MALFIFNILKILGSLAVFIYGMKLMSEGIQRAAGSSIRRILRKVTQNRIWALLTGILTTAIVQSSSATTVMTVSLVHAGLISLRESVGLMIGANIGTTSSAWIVTQLGFRFDLFSLSLPLFLVGMLLILKGREKGKFWGEFIIGFCLLFMGLNYLQMSIPDIDTEINLVNWIRDNTGSGMFTKILFVIVGALMTILIQSSSAAIVLTISMCVKGWIPFELGACLVLGENIGTTLTAELASLIGNLNARRSARIHTLFNVIGACWVLLLLPYFIQLVSLIVVYIFNLPDPLTDAHSSDYGLSVFHTMFNVANAIILLPFSTFLIFLAKKTVVYKEEEKVNRLKFFGSDKRTPDLSMLEVRKAIGKFSDILLRIHLHTEKLFNSFEKSHQDQMINKIDKYENITNNLENEIVSYISAVSKEEMSFSTFLKFQSMLNVCNEMERIADSYLKISKELDSKRKRKIWLNRTQRACINELMLLVYKIMEQLGLILNTSNFSNHNQEKISLLINSTRKYSRHIKNPINMVSEEIAHNEPLNEQGEIVYDNILYQFTKLCDNIENIIDYIDNSKR